MSYLRLTQELTAMFGVLLVAVLISLVPGTSSPDHQQTFTGLTGTNVTLEFHVPDGTTSVWLKRPGSDKYIFTCRDGHPIRPEDQEELFRGRVEGTDCEELNGTVTVTVKDVNTSDNGTYEFHGVRSDDGRFNGTVVLIVTHPVNLWIYLLCAGAAVCIVVGFIYKGRRRKSRLRPNVLEPQCVNLDIKDEEEEEEEDEEEAAACPLKKDSAVVF